MGAAMKLVHSDVKMLNIFFFKDICDILIYSVMCYYLFRTEHANWKQEAKYKTFHHVRLRTFVVFYAKK